MELYSIIGSFSLMWVEVMLLGAGAPETKLQWEKCRVRSREKQPKKEKKRSDIKMMMMYRNEQ